ncbi:prepilin-type N-terminal cleavage/methylation domain-containing protein [Desulfotomaculum nigrificans]|uniref:prepilin-type N-terminal cleavage/methylation domain-containing protein n=1 Tax=Desulfotomaculum nigrificans TaxID=1565 RepID=UPI0001FAE7E0|nr:prepilin-type N-terminal cleavage/methylation domain-containing protein [Desulfotomaculum nigrificans]
MKNYLQSLGQLVKTNKGFTLVELVVVIMILGIITAMSMPNFGRPLSDYKLYTAARQLATDIRSLEQKSINLADDKYNNYSNYIMFGSKNKYLINEVIPSTGDNVQVIQRSVNLPSGIEIFLTNFTNNMLVFNRSGGTSSGGTISLKSTVTGKQLYVIVLTGSGRVRVSNTPASE